MGVHEIISVFNLALGLIYTVGIYLRLQSAWHK
jgi:hypothetical protein